MAQVEYVRTLGVEAARHDVQANLIAQHFVEIEACVPAASRLRSGLRSSAKPRGLASDNPQHLQTINADNQLTPQAVGGIESLGDTFKMSLLNRR